MSLSSVRRTDHNTSHGVQGPLAATTEHRPSGLRHQRLLWEVWGLRSDQRTARLVAAGGCRGGPAPGAVLGHLALGPLRSHLRPNPHIASSSACLSLLQGFLSSVTNHFCNFQIKSGLGSGDWEDFTTAQDTHGQTDPATARLPCSLEEDLFQGLSPQTSWAPAGPFLQVSTSRAPSGHLGCGLDAASPEVSPGNTSSHPPYPGHTPSHHLISSGICHYPNPSFALPSLSVSPAGTEHDEAGLACPAHDRCCPQLTWTLLDEPSRRRLGGVCTRR